jgi:hypothetical protein
MGDPRVASPILRRPARFGLAASDRGYAGCELRRISNRRSSQNSVKRKSNFAECTFHALG